MAKVVILGAGVIGLCAAYYASGRGHSVTVVDRNGPEHENCSYGNAGLIVPSHFVPLAAPGMVALGLKWMWNPESPFYIKPRLDAGLLDWGLKFWRAATPMHTQRSAPLLRDLNRASQVCFEEMAASLGNAFDLVNRGLLVLCGTEHAFEHEVKMADMARRLGLSVECLDARQAQALEPGVPMSIAGAVHFKDDCHLTPALFMKRLIQELDTRGVKILWRHEASRWTARQNRIESLILKPASSHAPEIDLPAGEFVVCGGSWSPQLLSQLQVKLPMQPGKGYSLTLPAPRQLPSIPSILTEARIAVTPMGGSLRFAGTMELAGMSEAINPARVRGIVKAVPRYYPDFSSADFENIQPWCGLRPCSPDGLPFVGRTKRWANLSIGTGHAMMGLSLGPVSGRLISEILSGEKPSLPIEALSPDRYSREE